tara:strand:+ start:414 stop:755 length:342 start_codon:yes stop_codon:yes gene_type:complete
VRDKAAPNGDVSTFFEFEMQDGNVRVVVQQNKGFPQRSRKKDGVVFKKLLQDPVHSLRNNAASNELRIVAHVSKTIPSQLYKYFVLPRIRPWERDATIHILAQSLDLKRTKLK